MSKGAHCTLSRFADWKEWLIPQSVSYHWTTTQWIGTGWRAGQRGTNCRFCTWGGKPHAPKHSALGGWLLWRQLCGEGPRTPCRQQPIHEPAVPLGPKMPMVSWSALGIQLPGGWGWWSCPSALPPWGYVWHAVFSSGFLNFRKKRNYWRGSSEGLQQWLGDRSISLIRKGWENWTCLAWRWSCQCLEIC